jgi:hypothetical protein
MRRPVALTDDGTAFRATVGRRAKVVAAGRTLALSRAKLTPAL